MNETRPGEVGLGSWVWGRCKMKKKGDRFIYELGAPGRVRSTRRPIFLVKEKSRDHGVRLCNLDNLLRALGVRSFGARESLGREDERGRVGRQECGMAGTLWSEAVWRGRKAAGADLRTQRRLPTGISLGPGCSSSKSVGPSPCRMSHGTRPRRSGLRFRSAGRQPNTRS